MIRPHGPGISRSANQLARPPDLGGWPRHGYHQGQNVLSAREAIHGTAGVPHHLRHDVGRQRGAPAQLRRGRRPGRGPARQGVPLRRERRGAVERREVRGALADRLGHRDRASSRGRARRTSRTPWLPRRPFARVGSPRVAGAGPDPAQGRRRDGGPAVRPRGAHGLRGRQEPARGARRRPGDRRADPVELRRDGERRVPHADVGARGAAGDYYDVLRPYGVWGVISPFNFPFALAGGPTSGALVAGNCVVLKPSNRGALMGYKLYECFRDGGVPPGALPRRDRPRRGRGRGALASPPTSAGSRSPARTRSGMDIYKHFASDVPKPVICEMGGKNPAIVSDERRPGQGDRRRPALGLRVRRTEVLGELARVRRARGVRRVPRTCSSRRPRRSRSATRSSANVTSGRSSTRRDGDVRGGGGGGRRTARSSPAASA